ncbi:MAG: MBL fold metallo-hydrolase [Patescibacteria group bacterium]|nr:MBL fold metallo-hydrolase [Patescibacteria group bacterium]
MKISFHGAAREVTGSCFLVENDDCRVLVDCGMHQGTTVADAENFKDFPFDPKTVDAVIVTHAHLDHVGRLPKLVKEGFKGKIYATPPTVELASVVLKDAEQVMEDAYRSEYRPKLFESADVEKTEKLFKAVDYSRKVRLDGLTFRFRDAGHILGSAFVEMEENGRARAAFSGDLGNIHDPILKPTAQLAAQDVLLIESTYGNRLHETVQDRSKQLKQYIINTIKRAGVLIIPAFAIERTQVLLFELNHLVENRLIPPVDIFLDSPMAIKATEIMQDFPQYYNQTALQQVCSGDDIMVFPGLEKTLTRDDSKRINDSPRPKVIIAGSGMMNGGRILHHLVRYLGDARSMVLIIGYQASGTLGRRLYNGDKHVEVLSERINVKAEIKSIGAYSAHADQKQLINWIKQAEQLPKHVYCTHGEEEASASLATRINEEFGITADVPRIGDTIII